MKGTSASSELRAAVFILTLLTTVSSGYADYVFESATMGQPAQTAGPSVSPIQFLAARFHLNQPTVVDHIGGHLMGNIQQGQAADSTMFAAITRIDAPGGFPTDTPSTFQPLAVTVFSAPFPSADVSVPLTLDLPPGDYAVMFGSGRFGATGSGGMPLDNLPLTAASDFFESYSGNDSWRSDAQLLGLRFTVSGVAVPEPPSISLAAFGFLGLMAWGWRRRKL